MNVGNICQREVVTIGSDESLAAAAQLMRKRHVGFLVVMSPDADSKVIGVLTDRDIVTAVVAKEADARAFKVGDVMTANPLLIDETYTIEGALRHMRDIGVRRVPIVSATGNLLGVLSLDDVVESLANQFSDLAGAIRIGQKLERTVRP
jgi:CBS domain-containing protein